MMFKRYLSLLVFGAIGLPGLSVAAGDKPPAPTLHGPTAIAATQPFNVRFSYPKGSAKSYVLESFHCQPGTNAPPSNDSNAEPWPVQGCEPAETYSPHAISPDTGQVTIDVKYGVSAIHQYKSKNASAKATEQWLQGNWYVRVRLVSMVGVRGDWSRWHHTLIGSGNISKPVGTKGFVGNQHRVATSVIMRGLKPPRVTAPAQHKVFHAGSVRAAVTVPSHTPYSDWACCDIQWQRAAVITKENAAGGFPTARSTWKSSLNFAGYSMQQESGPMVSASWGYDTLRPHSRKFGFQYWFRVRERYSSGNAPGPWSAWRTFIVQERKQSPTLRPIVHGMIKGKSTTGGTLAPGAATQRMHLPAQ